jgi:hypothetical protein
MPETNTTLAPPRSYATDYAGWIEDTARAIEDGRFNEIDRKRKSNPIYLETWKA